MLIANLELKITKELVFLFLFSGLGGYFKEFE